MKHLNQLQNVKKVMMQTLDLVLTSLHRSCQATFWKKFVWLLGPCLPCLSHITCLTVNHTCIPCANLYSNLLYLHCNLFLFFIFSLLWCLILLLLFASRETGYGPFAFQILTHTFWPHQCATCSIPHFLPQIILYMQSGPSLSTHLKRGDPNNSW